MPLSLSSLQVYASDVGAKSFSKGGELSYLQVFVEEVAPKLIAPQTERERVLSAQAQSDRFFANAAATAAALKPKEIDVIREFLLNPPPDLIDAPAERPITDALLAIADALLKRFPKRFDPDPELELEKPAPQKLRGVVKTIDAAASLVDLGDRFLRQFRFLLTTSDESLVASMVDTEIRQLPVLFGRPRHTVKDPHRRTRVPVPEL